MERRRRRRSPLAYQEALLRPCPPVLRRGEVGPLTLQTAAPGPGYINTDGAVP